MSFSQKKTDMAGSTAYKILSSDISEKFFENQIVPEFITTKRAADLLGISENALRIKVCRGQIAAHKLGRSLRFRQTEIANLFIKKELKNLLLKEISLS